MTVRPKGMTGQDYKVICDIKERGVYYGFPDEGAEENEKMCLDGYFKAHELRQLANMLDRHNNGKPIEED